MKENTDEKSLMKISENSILNKIKKFFRYLFLKNKSNYIIPESNAIIEPNECKRSIFTEEIKNIGNKETLILDLQKKYRNGEIKGKDLTHEQIYSLCKLYDNQIDNLRKSNEIRKQKLSEYRKKIQVNN